MKTTYVTRCAGILLCAATMPLFAQQAPTRLIVRADDMGAFHSANTASIACFQHGIETSVEVMAGKEASFLSRINKLETGKTYMFLDHPSYNDAEMQTVGHVGYEDVAVDRQGVVELFTSEKVKQAIADKGIRLISYNDLLKALPRSTFAAGKVDGKAIPKYLKAVRNVRSAPEADWVQGFLAAPLVHEPGTFFVYNSLGTYVLSAIIQKVTGEKLLDYLYPRLFRPPGIVGAVWDESPQGINTGGWGLYLKTEDLAKMGLFILQKGKWNGVQLLPEAWFDEATSSHIASLPAGRRPEQITSKTKEVDWLQGYGYQMWRSRHKSFRADGANGQYILILPEKDAVIVTTANIRDMQEELNLIWKHLLPALK